MKEAMCRITESTGIFLTEDITHQLLKIITETVFKDSY